MLTLSNESNTDMLVRPKNSFSYDFLFNFYFSIYRMGTSSYYDTLKDLLLNIRICYLFENSAVRLRLILLR